MQGITFSRINTKTFNIVLCILLPLVLMACLVGRMDSLAKLDLSWILSIELLKMIFVLMCYAVPLAYFLTKIYELTTDSSNRTSSFFAFIASCILILPLAFIGLVMFAKLSFLIPMALTLAVFYLYFRSLKPIAVQL